MNTLTVEQAVFASSDRGRLKGYQLVARSSGIDAALGQELCRWAPTKFPSHDSEQWTLNYYPINQDRVAVTRTVLGGPEYSGRGGTQVVTLILVLDKPTFVAYGCNPIHVAKHALAMGALSLPLELVHDALPPATLPSEPIVEAPQWRLGDGASAPICESLCAQIIHLVNQSQRIAVVGLQNPIDALSHLLPMLSPEQRWNLSFTTGLAPTAVRPFQLHCLTTADAARQRTLDAQDIVRVDATAVGTTSAASTLDLSGRT
ncbi:GAP1-N2 domain-containing protein [Roseimaritima ulvae]|uniref:GTPase-associated protein 1 N-terminal domain-containing protein n=1 Tax=Roseimaritima ulvae TaxID=980254 RepID=A0A5B9QSY0_9BACT|nr:hypothetical protein [Roseimaritima ulvae]QEG41039.1 hypothetical protein UC8_30570 [Roseimaritima ulvae]